MEIKLMKPKLKILKHGKDTYLYLNGNRIDFVKDYSLSENAQGATLTLTIDVDKGAITYKTI